MRLGLAVSALMTTSLFGSAEAAASEAEKIRIYSIASERMRKCLENKQGTLSLDRNIKIQDVLRLSWHHCDKLHGSQMMRAYSYIYTSDKIKKIYDEFKDYQFKSMYASAAFARWKVYHESWTVCIEAAVSNLSTLTNEPASIIIKAAYPLCSSEEQTLLEASQEMIASNEYISKRHSHPSTMIAEAREGVEPRLLLAVIRARAAAAGVKERQGPTIRRERDF